MIFRPIQLEDKHFFKLDSVLYGNYRGSELVFANLYAWKNMDNIKISVNDDYIVLKATYQGNECFFPPIVKTSEKMVSCLRQMFHYCDQKSSPFIMSGCDESLLSMIFPLLPKNAILSKQPDLFEYLHNPEDLMTFRGKKLHAKRNFLNRFLKNYSFEFREYRLDDLRDILCLFEEWNVDNATISAEKDAIKTILQHLKETDSFCDVIELDGKAKAFSIGTITSNNTGIVLFEKADTHYQGIYAALTHLVATKRYHSCDFINRQEDMGIEELKKSKLSYKPVSFASKMMITIEDEAYQNKKQLRNLYEQSFADTKNYIDFFFAEKSKSSTVLFSKKEGTIASALYLIEKEINFLSTVVRFPYIVAAATDIQHRNKGLMTGLIKMALTKMHEQKVALTGLNPMHPNYYERFGFAFGSYVIPQVISLKENGNIQYRKLDLDEFCSLSTLYSTLQSRFDVSIERNEKTWTQYFREVILDGGFIELLSLDGKDVGYLSYVNDQIEEICLLDSNNLACLNKYKGLHVNLPSTEKKTPYNMVRIVNLISFLNLYRFDPSITISLDLKVVDSFLECNNFIVSLSIKDGLLHIKPSERFDDYLSVDDLTKHLFSSEHSNLSASLKAIFKPLSLLIYDRY